MPRKMRSPIMRRAWKQLVVSPMGKIRKPITTIIGLDMRSKVFLFGNPLKRFKLLKHRDNYGYRYEHQISPGSTPLFGWDQKSSPFKKKPLFLFLLCGGGGGMDEVYLGDVSQGINVLDENEEAKKLWGDKEEEEEGESVDRRAEEFIQRFYEEMRSQN